MSDVTAADEAAVSRRGFLRRTAIVGGILLPFTIAGRKVLASPAEARAAAAPLRFLTAGEAAVLEAIGEALVPGSARAGLAHYVDQQCGGAPADCMLMGRYLGLQPPFGPFYRAALGAVRTALAAAIGETASARASSLATSLQGAFTGKAFAGWDGPPAGFVYFVLRSDAIDVVYGTPEGFERLGVPYMAHIQPPSGWGG
ncbi:MAG: twin-arginine translocation signal domain-containing protein [Steroidobacteraceae bacterium]